MEGSGMKGYDVLLKGVRKILEDHKYETKEKWFSELKLINKTAYKDLILAQEDTICFHLTEEAKTKANMDRDAR